VKLNLQKENKKKYLFCLSILQAIIAYNYICLLNFIENFLQDSVLWKLKPYSKVWDKICDIDFWWSSKPRSGASSSLPCCSYLLHYSPSGSTLWYLSSHVLGNVNHFYL